MEPAYSGSTEAMISLRLAAANKAVLFSSQSLDKGKARCQQPIIISECTMWNG